MSDNNISNQSQDKDENALKVTPGAWIALIAVLLVFSGLFLKSKTWPGWGPLTLLRSAEPSGP